MDSIFATPADFTTPHCDRFGRVLCHVTKNNWGSVRGYDGVSSRVPWSWRVRVLPGALETVIRWQSPLKALCW